jgi:hypothetical protein
MLTGELRALTPEQVRAERERLQQRATLDRRL